MNFISKSVVLTTIATAFSSVAMAAVDPAVSTALGDTKTDVAAVGALGLVIVVAIAGFKYLRRAL